MKASGHEKEPTTMTEHGGNDRQFSTTPGDSPSSLLPMLISGLALILIGMIAVAALA
jgi:hypothetical protein